MCRYANIDNTFIKKLYIEKYNHIKKIILDGKCIPQKFVCDNITDCDDKADEKHCDHIIRCYTNQFKCNDGSCLPLQKVCDGVTDCEDGYDEALCDGGITSPPRPTCNPGMFACDTLRCFPLTFKCDGHQDCYDGTDEDNCGPNTTRVYQVFIYFVPKEKEIIKAIQK